MKKPATVLILIMIYLILAVVISAGDVTYFQAEQPHFYYNASSELYIEPIDSAIASARSDLMKILRDSLSYKPTIYIRDNLDDFRKLIGSAFPDWGAAAALPYRKMIALKSPAHFRLGKSLRMLVKHEYGHLALHDRLYLTEPPRWLDEGVAMYISAEWGWSENFTMSKAVVFNSLVPLRDIEMLNRFSEGKAQIAYAEAYLAVKYIIDVYEPVSFNILLDSLKARRSVDEAMLDAIGGNYDEFEKEFFDYLQKRYNIMTLFGDLTFLWLFLALVVLIGFFLKFRKKKQYYEKWEEEEKYQSTDFDYGDPDNPEQIDDEDKPWL